MHPKLLRPSRARLAEARAVVDGRDDAASAWESLAAADLIPMEWVHHEARSYVVDSPSGSRIYYFPPTVELCVLLAADAPAVRAAELIARETQRGLRFPDAVLWRLIGGGRVHAERNELDRSLRSGALELPAGLVETGFCLDPAVFDRVGLLMPGEEPPGEPPAWNPTPRFE
jgi:hypothetical protein